MKAAAFLLAGLTMTAVAQSPLSLDSPVSFSLQSHPDLRLESGGSGKPSPAWSGVIKRSDISPAQGNSFHNAAPRLDYPGPGYRMLSEKP